MAPEQGFGKIGIVLSGGGCKYVDQLFRLRSLLQYLEARALSVQHVTSNSAGCFVALGMLAAPTPLEGVEHAIRISKEKTNTHKKIFRRHPNIEKKISDFRHILPHLPWHHKHASFRELYDDCTGQLRNLFSIIGFGFRAVRFVFSAIRDVTNSSIFQPAFSSDNEATIKHIADYFCSDFKAFYDLQPLMEVLTEEIDTRWVVNSPITWHLLAKRVEDQKRVAFSPHEYVGIDPYLAKTGILNHILISCALYPLFEIKEVEENGSLVHYVDYDVEDPLPIDDALDAGCDTIFVLTAVSEKHFSLPKKHPLLALLGLYANTNRSLVRERIKNAQRQAKQEPKGKNIFIIPPVPHHPDLGLLFTSSDAIEYHEKQEADAMKACLQDLDAYNLRLLPDIE